MPFSSVLVPGAGTINSLFPGSTSPCAQPLIRRVNQDVYLVLSDSGFSFSMWKQTDGTGSFVQQDAGTTCAGSVYGMSASADGSTIYVQAALSSTLQIFKYDTATDTWQDLTAGFNPRHTTHDTGIAITPAIASSDSNEFAFFARATDYLLIYTIDMTVGLYRGALHVAASPDMITWTDLLVINVPMHGAFDYGVFNAAMDSTGLVHAFFCYSSDFQFSYSLNHVAIDAANNVSSVHDLGMITVPSDFGPIPWGSVGMPTVDGSDHVWIPYISTDVSASVLKVAEGTSGLNPTFSTSVVESAASNFAIPGITLPGCVLSSPAVLAYDDGNYPNRTWITPLASTSPTLYYLKPWGGRHVRSIYSSVWNGSGWGAPALEYDAVANSGDIQALYGWQWGVSVSPVRSYVEGAVPVDIGAYVY